MSQDGTYIHGSSDAREVGRLERQADFISPRFHPLLEVASGDVVLDLATGVGAMAARLKRRRRDIQIFGLDLRMAQLKHAHANHASAAAYVQANGEHIPFRDGTFHKVYCSWMLEHVPRPVAILREVHRVLRPGGGCLFIEVENSTFRTVPAISEAIEVMGKLNDAQVRGGGDPYVGAKLQRYFHEAGFSKVTVTPGMKDDQPNDPKHVREMCEEFAEIFESADEALGPKMLHTIEKAASKLRALPSQPGAEFHYTSYVALGMK